VSLFDGSARNSFGRAVSRHDDGAEEFNAFNTPWLAATKLKNAISGSSFGTITW
jgi:hypothetical protein